MFVSLTPDDIKVKDWWKRWAKYKAESPDPSWDDMKPITDLELMDDETGKLYPGFYIGDVYDLPMFIEFPDTPSYFDEFMFFELDSRMKSQYGVADTPEQIIERFRREYDDPNRKFVVLVDGVDLESADNNEKFYKQGPYIGKAKYKGSSDYCPDLKTDEIKKNGCLIRYHIFPLPGTEPYPSRKYSILKKYVIPGKPAIKGNKKIEIIKHDPGVEFWKRNGSVEIKKTIGKKSVIEHTTLYMAIWSMYNLIYFDFLYLD